MLDPDFRDLVVTVQARARDFIVMKRANISIFSSMLRRQFGDFWKRHSGRCGNLEMDFDWLHHFVQNYRRTIFIVGIDENFDLSTDAVLLEIVRVEPDTLK